MLSALFYSLQADYKVVVQTWFSKTKTKLRESQLGKQYIRTAM